MDNLSKAFEAEFGGRLPEAIDFYERAIAENPNPPLDVFINLMFLYFETQDYGNEVEYKLTIEFVTKSFEKISFLYEKAKKLYPKSIELDFWENYIFYRYPYGPAYNNIDERFFRQKQDVIPFFFAYSPKTGAYTEEALKIWDIVKDGRTFKERYIRGWIGDGIAGRYTG